MNGFRILIPIVILNNLETDMELDYELTWYESEELSWWAEHPTATEAEFEAAFYGEMK